MTLFVELDTSTGNSLFVVPEDIVAVHPLNLNLGHDRTAVFTRQGGEFRTTEESNAVAMKITKAVASNLGWVDGTET